MAETLAEQLNGSALKEMLLQAVAAEDLDHIPLDFDDQARFILSAVRAVAHREEACDLCALIYSDAPLADGAQGGFARIVHMQDGHGSMSGKMVLTGRDANNGSCHPLSDKTILAAIEQIEAAGFGSRATILWDGVARSATVYPEGVSGDAIHQRFLVPVSDDDLTQDDLCEVLNIAYDDNLKNPSGGTVNLWTKGKLVSKAEDEIEKVLKGQIGMYFLGKSRPVKVLRQTNTAAGRTDLILTQKPPSGGLRLVGVLELKVLRGPETADHAATEEGLSQGHFYREDIHVPFATLALYDVGNPPSGDTAPLLIGQNPDHLATVRVRRFPIYNSPSAWRKAGGPKAA
ncbi:hypothetical protein QO010_004533 [Caulobacter ginsengisoli]|uniref:Protein NO VEIN C-terminal domain-containing protein n=1 Tax=Caulobacter ginsengisoli TaxID=400775 RepID=A0ABU0IXK5_9CAUL|nr:hypothetical protein [Caulobacter ginsengisoli]MDQ0466737.1 hypothetical protein [Caulobacter ginsengisoli]